MILVQYDRWARKTSRAATFWWSPPSSTGDRLAGRVCARALGAPPAGKSVTSACVWVSVWVVRVSVSVCACAALLFADIEARCAHKNTLVHAPETLLHHHQPFSRLPTFTHTLLPPCAYLALSRSLSLPAHRHPAQSQRDSAPSLPVSSAVPSPPELPLMPQLQASPTRTRRFYHRNVP